LALEPNAVLVRRLHSGTERLGGGTYERPFLVLFATDSDGRLARAEWFDDDREAEALARFEELVARAEPKRPVRRRLRPNAANAAVARFSAAFAARDTAAVEAMHGDRVEGTDHRWHTTYGRDGVLKSLRGLMKPPAAELRFEPMATLGERLSLDRYFYTSQGGTAGLFDIGENAAEYLRLVEVDPFGLIQRVEIFAIDRLGDAVARLYERHAELLPEGPARARAAATARSVAVWNGSIDLNRLSSAFDPSYRNIDHRFFGTWSTGSAAETLRHYRLQLDLAPDFAGRYDEVFAVNARALVARMTFLGTARDSGGPFENQLCTLIRFGADGRITHGEVFEAEQVVEALARFDELSGRGTDSVADWFENAAARTDRELFDRFNARDWAGVEVLAAPELVFDERRRMLHNTCGRDVWLEQFRVLYDVPASRFTTFLRATRGDRLSLNLHRFEGEVAEGGGPLAMDDHLVLHEVDGEGRIVAIVLFDLEDEDAAHAELDARFEAGEASTYPRLAGALATNRLMQARDWRACAARLAPGFVDRDHRRLGWGDAGHDAETLFRIQQSALDLSPDARYRADHIRLSARGILRQATLLGTRDGGAFEKPMFIVAAVDEQGRVASNDTYDIEDRDGALARLAELTGPDPQPFVPSSGLPTHSPSLDTAPKDGTYSERTGIVGPRIGGFENTASRAWREVIAAWRGRDLEHFAALQPGLHRYRDHRRLFQLDLDREGFLEFTRPLLTMRSASAVLELLATRGERLALMRFTLEMEDEVVGPSAIDSLLLIETDERGTITAYDRYEVDDQEAARAEIQARWEAGEGAAHRALARFAEIGAEPNPLAPFPASLPASARDRAKDPLAALVKRNLATASMERAWAAFDALDLDAARLHFAPDFLWEDRRPIVGLSGGLDLMIASARERIASGARHERRTIVGTAGDRVAIARVLWAGGPPDGRFEVEFLTVHEVNEAGLCTALIFLDPDDERGAQREAWTRWAAIDPMVAEVTAGVGEMIDAWNAKDLDRLRACYAENVVVEDHRWTGTGRSEGREAYLRSVVALWDLAPESRLDIGWFWLAQAPHGGVVTCRRSGTLPGGGEFVSDFLTVSVVEHGRATRIEIFEMDSADAALARFAELHPDPLRIPPNAATRARAQWAQAFGARDWEAVRGLVRADFVFEDRGKRALVTGDVETWIASAEFTTTLPGIRIKNPVIGTFGERILLDHLSWRGAPGGDAFEFERVMLLEIDEEGRFRTAILFDPDDRAAAFEEAHARFVASGAGTASPGTFELLRAWNTHDLARMRALLPDDFYLDDHRRTGGGRLDGADAYLASIAAMSQLSHDLRTETLYIVSVAAHGVVWVARWSGTNAEGGEFDAVYVCVGLQRDGRPAGLEIFEIDTLDAALARFEECHPARGQEKE
jgi:ketosteroid isomerase-like protein